MMPVARFQMPDGRIGRFQVPDGTTPEQAQSMIAQSLGQQADDEPHSALGQIGRQLGLTLRAGITGMTGLSGAIADVPVRVANALGANLSLPSEAQQSLMTKLGVPEPKSTTERMAGAITSGMAGAATGVGAGRLLSEAANPVAQGIGNVLQSSPGMQVASGATAGGAGQAVGEMGGGPGAQLAASMAGAALPGAAQFAAQSGARGLMRGGEQGRQQTAANIKEAGDRGITLPVASATENPVSEGIAGALSKLPGGTTPLAEAYDKTASEMGAHVNRLAKGLFQDADATVAGNRVKTGLSAFVDRFRNTQSSLYDDFTSKLPPETQVPITNFRSALAQLDPDDPVLGPVMKVINGNKIQQMRSATENAMAGTPGTPGPLVGANGQPIGGTPPTPPTDTVPISSVRKLRTIIGNKRLDTSLVTDDVTKQQYKQLYGALSTDLGQAANAAGPDAANAFNRANWFTRAGHDRIDSFLNDISGKSASEDMFRAATNGTRQGASKINAVMRSLEPDERQAVTAAFVNRLGWQGPDQAAAGNNFSLPKFISDWRSIDPKAKMALFGDHSGTMRTDLDIIANMANKVQRANVAGSMQGGFSRSMFLGGEAMALGGALATGHLGAAAGILSGIVATNQAAKLMTSQPFVHWLARTTVVSPSMIPSQINALAQVSKMENDPASKRAILNYQKTMQGGLNGIQ